MCLKRGVQFKKYTTLLFNEKNTTKIISKDFCGVLLETETLCPSPLID